MFVVAGLRFDTGSTGHRPHTTHDSVATFSRCTADAGTSGTRTIPLRRTVLERADARRAGPAAAFGLLTLPWTP